MRVTVAAAVLALACVVSACGPPPEFTVPLSPPSDVEVDERLLGEWLMADASVRDGELEPSDTFAFLRVGRNDDDGAFEVLWLDLGPGDEPEWRRFHVFPSTIDGLTFFNVKRLHGVGADYTASGETPGYIFIYPILLSDNALLVCFLHHGGWETPEAEKMLEQAGVPFRKVTGVHFGDYLIVEVTEEEMQELVRAEKLLPMFRALWFFTRVGYGINETWQPFMGFDLIEGCPFEGLPPEGSGQTE